MTHRAGSANGHRDPRAGPPPPDPGGVPRQRLGVRRPPSGPPEPLRGRRSGRAPGEAAPTPRGGRGRAGRAWNAGLATFEENDTSRCYALRDKLWVTGPGQEPWEVYVVKADADTLGKSAAQGTADAPEGVLRHHRLPHLRRTGRPGRDPCLDRDGLRMRLHPLTGAGAARRRRPSSAPRRIPAGRCLQQELTGRRCRCRVLDCSPWT